MYITSLYTRRRFNPVSWLIRYIRPRSRFALALSSHGMVLAGDTVYEATMWHGVRRVPREVALRGQTIVKMSHHQVPDPAAGFAWLDSQLCTYEPKLPRWLPEWLRRPLAALLLLLNNNYDWHGAFGLAFEPDRSWSEPGRWYCYELIAGALRAAGRSVFAELNHIGETALFSIAP